MVSKYRDHGIAAPAQEARTCAMTRGSDGRFYLVICARGFLLSVDLQAQEMQQFPYPGAKYAQAYPFGSIGSRGGKVCVGADNLFMEFDPAARAYTFSQAVLPDERAAFGIFSLDEAADGTISFGCYYRTHLIRFNPRTRELRHHGVLDEAQQYVGTLASDREGYLYCAIGTETGSIVVVEPEHGERRRIAAPAGCRVPEISRARDGNVYVTFDGDGLAFNEHDPAKRWYRLSGGELREEMTEPFENEHQGHGFDRIHCPYAERPEIVSVDLVEHELIYRHPISGETVHLTLAYETPGADLSPLTAGPDGRVYGTTNHPIQLYTYDPGTDELHNYGRRPFGSQYRGWGNICAYAAQGDILGGAAYCGGFIVRIDTRDPISRAESDRNPHCEGVFGEILRPRSAVALPDGRTMAFGGYAEYGATGGGLVLYDSEARTCAVIPNEQLIPNQSILAMVALSPALLLCGTSIEAPGGGFVLADEATLFLFDLTSRKVVDTLVPVSGARTIAHLKKDRLGLIHGITEKGIHFAFDPERRTVLRTTDLSQHGQAVRDGLTVAENGIIYGLLTNGIYAIAPGADKPVLLARPPIPVTAGMALIGGRIYFGSGSHLWSVALDDLYGIVDSANAG